MMSPLLLALAWTGCKRVAQIMLQKAETSLFVHQKLDTEVVNFSSMDLEFNAEVVLEVCPIPSGLGGR